MTATYLGRQERAGDHVPATPAWKTLACRAYFRGAVGDCTRAKGHDGPHQDANGYAWTAEPTPVCDACGEYAHDEPSECLLSEEAAR